MIVLTLYDPVQLTIFVWYITVYYGLCRCEIQTKMRKTDLDLQQDDLGEFIVLSTSFASKNAPGGRQFKTVSCLQDEKQVAAVHLFLQKLHPENNRLFQRARMGKVKSDNAAWFTKQPFGHNLLRMIIMVRLSASAKLSK